MDGRRSVIVAGLLVIGSSFFAPAAAAASDPAATTVQVRPARIAALSYGDLPAITGSAWWDDGGDLAPVVGGAITLEAKDWRTGWATVATTATDGGGRFTLRPRLEPGRWSLRVALAPDGGRAGSIAPGGAVQVRPADTGSS